MIFALCKLEAIRQVDNIILPILAHNTKLCTSIKVNIGLCNEANDCIIKQMNYVIKNETIHSFRL